MLHPPVYVPQRRCTVGPTLGEPSEWRPVGHNKFFRTLEDAKECIATFRRESLSELTKITQFRIITLTASDIEAA